MVNLDLRFLPGVIGVSKDGRFEKNLSKDGIGEQGTV
jgi:hypothetical protein